MSGKTYLSGGARGTWSHVSMNHWHEGVDLSDVSSHTPADIVCCG